MAENRHHDEKETPWYTGSESFQRLRRSCADDDVQHVAKLRALSRQFGDAMRGGLERRAELASSTSTSMSSSTAAPSVDASVSATEGTYDEMAYCGLKMLPSYVRSLPNGSEKGVFYSVDVGGSNLRVMKIVLGENGNEANGHNGNGNGSSTTTSSAAATEASSLFARYLTASVEVEIPPELMRGTTRALFAFIAEALVRFVAAEHRGDTEGRTAVVAFTFSFPMRQELLDAGTLIAWTKGFNCVDGVGDDVVALLRSGCDDAMAAMRAEQQHTKPSFDAVNVLCLVNDTVGTLAAARFMDVDASVAVIAGTGSNAAFVVNSDAELKKTATSTAGEEKGEVEMQTMVNIEWGNFQCDDLLRLSAADEDGDMGGFYLEADATIDAASANRGEQFFEKMVAGMYLGELCRLTAEAVMRECGRPLPRRDGAEGKAFAFTTPMMVSMEAGKEHTTAIAAAFGIDEIRDAEALADLIEVLRLVCPLVCARAAQLAGAALTSVISALPLSAPKQGRRLRVAVAVDGGVYVNYPSFRETLHRTVSTLFESGDDEVDVDIDIDACRDGSGFGAAVVAAGANDNAHL